MVDATHAYLVLRGSYTFGGLEKWQVGIRFMFVNSGTAPDNVGTLPTFGVHPEVISRTETNWTIVGDWSADLGLTESIAVDDWLNDQVATTLRDVVFPHASNKVQLDELHAWPIASDGSVVDGRTMVLTFTGSKPGGNVTGNPLPLENSVVVSWATGRIGRHGRGRIYWPTQAVTDIDATGLLSSTPQTAVKTDWVTALEAFAITPTGLGNHWALPIVTGKPYANYAVITGIKVGNVVDTQRRRRRQLVESYVTGTTSYG